MGLLWVLVLLLIIFALVGGFAVSNWLFVILVIAVILALSTGTGTLAVGALLMARSPQRFGTCATMRQTRVLVRRVV